MEEDTRQVAIDAARKLIAELESLPDRSYIDIRWKKEGSSVVCMQGGNMEPTNPEAVEIDPLARVVTMIGYTLMGLREEVVRAARLHKRDSPVYSAGEKQVITKLLKKV